MAKKLEMALVDLSWYLAFLEAFAENLCRVYFDHCSVLIHCSGTKAMRGARPFRFQVVWSSHNQFESIVRHVWAKGSPNMLKGLKEVQDNTLGVW